MMASLEEIELIPVQSIKNPEGSLFVVQSGKQVPFSIARVFFVTAKAGQVRGKHAHKRCTQVLMCVSGVIEVEYTDGVSTKKILLDKPDVALYLKPGIWAKQTYVTDHAVLSVLCDTVYEEDDYLRNFEEFCAYRSLTTGKKV